MSSDVSTLPLPRTFAPAARLENKWLITISITFGTLMGAIDSSIVNVAINNIRGSVGATLEEITWISTGFALASVIVMPLTAFFGRQFGQKRTYMACLVLFLAGSLLCGFAWSLPSLIAFRVIQGFGAGALQPTEQAILRQTFPPAEQGTAMAIFGMAVMIGPAVGPTLGGYIVDNYAWPWIFFINLPVGALGLFMVQRFVKDPEDIRQANLAAAEKERANLDWIGIVLMCVGIAALQYVLEEGDRKDWFESTLICAVTFTAVVGLAAFVIRELTAKSPVVDLRLFKEPVYMSSTLITALMFCMLMASMFLLPVFMQTMLGFTAMQSGMAMIPRVGVMMAIVPFAGKLYGRVLSAKQMVAIGICSFGVGSYFLSHLTLQSGIRQVIFASMVQGVGFAFLFPALQAVSLSRVPRQQLTNATGLSSLIRQFGGSMGLAAFATMLSRRAIVAKVSIGAHVSLADPNVYQRVQAMTAGLMAKGLDAITAQRVSLASLDGMVTAQSMVLSFEQLFTICGILFLCIMPLLFLMKEPPKSYFAKPTPGETKPEVHMEM